MFNVDWTQLSIGASALVILGYLGGKALDGIFKKERQDSRRQVKVQDELKQVIENNTAATNTLISFLQVTLTKNETCMEQVVKQTEHIPGMAKQVSAIWDVVNK